MSLSDMQNQIAAFRQQSAETTQEWLSELASIKELIQGLLAQKQPSADHSTNNDTSSSSYGLLNQTNRDSEPTDLPDTTSFRLQPDLTIEAITVKDEGRADSMDYVLDDLVVVNEVKPKVTIIDYCLSDAGLLEVVLHEHCALGEMPISYQKAISSNISCTHGVRQNAHETLISYFLPPKPPDEYLNMVTLLNLNNKVLQYDTCAENYMLELEVQVSFNSILHSEMLLAKAPVISMPLMMRVISIEPVQLHALESYKAHMINHGIKVLVNNESKYVGFGACKVCLHDFKRLRISSVQPNILVKFIFYSSPAKPPDIFFRPARLLGSEFMVDIGLSSVLENEFSYWRTIGKTHHLWFIVLSCKNIFYWFHKYREADPFKKVVTLGVISSSIKMRDITFGFLWSGMKNMVAVIIMEVVNLFKFKHSSSWITVDRTFLFHSGWFNAVNTHKNLNLVAIFQSVSLSYSHLKFAIGFSHGQISYVCHELCLRSLELLLLSFLIEGDLKDSAKNMSISFAEISLMPCTITFSMDSALKKDGFIWSVDADKAFENLKLARCNPPVLALPNFDKDFVIKTDASNTGIGAVLLQENHQISYISSAFDPRHETLSVYEKEPQVVVHAVQAWLSYLTHRPFIIKIDQWSLKYLLEQKVTTAFRYLWLSKLMGYSFELHYKQGKDNVATDALSRVNGSQQAVVNLKLALSNPLVLALPKFDKDFIIETDASNTGIRAVLRWHTTPRKFQVGDFVYLKLHPYKQHSFKNRLPHKLSPRFFGPFRAQDRVGLVAYELELPSETAIHNVFHISQLKFCPTPPSRPLQQVPKVSSLRSRMLPTGEYCDRVYLGQLSCKCLGPISFFI